jgi:putative DNA primase/helicase
METISKSNDVHKVFVTFYKSELTPSPKRQGLITVGNLIDVISTHDVRESKSGPAFALHQLQPDSSRKNSNVVTMTGCIADIDDGAIYPYLQPRIADLFHAAYSTHSHAPSDGKHKFRIVIPFARPVTPDEYPSIWEAVNARLGGVMDPACRDLARLYYLPSCPPERQPEAFSVVQEGELLAPDAILAVKAMKSAPSPILQAVLGNSQSSPPALSEVERMLPHVDPFCDRKEWMDILFALASTYGAAAEDLARRWSRGELRHGGHRAG